MILEAMASSLPCVTTKVSGCGDLIDDGVNGYFFPANDTEGLQIALKRLQSCDMTEMGLEARNFVEKNFSLSELANRYESLYLDLFDGLNG